LAPQISVGNVSLKEETKLKQYVQQISKY
jgi:hypothetical protein